MFVMPATFGAALRRVLVSTLSGAPVPLEQLADILEHRSAQHSG